jgi:molybdate transport system substrate-binding protein
LTLGTRKKDATLERVPGDRQNLYRFLLAALGLIVIMNMGCGQVNSSRPPGQTGSLASTEERVITIFAAASLTNPFKVIATEYRRQHPRNRVILNFDGSQRLRTQLEHGAAADLFASADWDQMRAVEALGLTASPPANFASNNLVILGYAGPGGNLETVFFNPVTHPSAFRSKMKTLAKPGTKIVVGQPEVPIGRYTEQMLENMAAQPDLGQDLVEGLTANVVSRESSVSAIVQKVNLGEADAGVVYSSDAQVDYAGVGVLELPDSINVTAHYPVAALTRTPGADKFVDFVLSQEGQRVLHSYGFGPPSVTVEANP